MKPAQRKKISKPAAVKGHAPAFRESVGCDRLAASLPAPAKPALQPPDDGLMF